MNTITIPVDIRTRWRFCAVVHTGHKYDEFGNVVEFGRTLRRTELGNNKITLTGFNNIFNNVSENLVVVVGAGNAAPTEGDGALGAYLGKSQSFASYSTTRNTTPDANGDVWWRCTKRVTFGPGSLGGGSVNVSEAGIVLGVPVGSVDASSQVSARGLLVDGSNNPTTVSVNNAVEYLDVIWEYTEWIKASTLGTVTLKIDGVDVVHDYEVRPYYFDNAGGSYNYWAWREVGPTAFVGVYGVGDSTYGWPAAPNNFDSAPVSITGTPLGNGVRADIPIQEFSTYVSNSKQRSIKLTWLPTQGNKNTSLIRLSMGHTGWQIWYDPAIAKVNTKQLDLQFVLSYANK